MKTVSFDHPHRRKHFDFFREMNHPHFCVCAPVEVAPWVKYVKERGHRLTTSLVYLLARAANDQPEFRRRIRGDEVVEHELVHPSFAVPTSGTDVFSFCEVRFGEDFAAFRERTEQRMAAMRDTPSFEDEPGRDDFLFLSALPWVAFTAVTHPMSYHPTDSVPRITWGKIQEQGDRMPMPLSVQVHHALVDGVHVGRFFTRVEELAANPEGTIG
jgi:chloramphenicol O-acetyltransferase type A